MVENEKLLSAKEVCELLKVTNNNLHQIQYRGSLKWVERKGRKVFYDRDQVNAYIELRQKRSNKKQ